MWMFKQAAGSALRTYTTNFPLTENPISESGLWTKRGLAEGLDWTNPRTSGGLYFGTQTGDNSTDDSIGAIAGPWANDQDVSATVHIGTRPGAFSELEILLRVNISGHSAQLYEFYSSMAASPDRYSHITRWNGAFNDFTDLESLGNVDSPTWNDGDVMRATCVGNILTMYRNGTPIMSHDTTGDTSRYTSGLVGLGHFAQTHASSSQWAFSSATFKDFGA